MLGAGAAVADTVLLLVLGVPYAVLWGVLSFLFSFVPNIGFILALVPPTVFALLELGLGPAVLVVVGYVVINLAFDYVLQPRIMATDLDISPVVVIVAILVWTAFIGPVGALLAVPLTLALRVVLVPFEGARVVRRAPRAGARRGRGATRRSTLQSAAVPDPVAADLRLVTARVFRRSASPNPPVAVEAHGSTIVDAEGREYLDAAGGAIVVNVGHGRREIADAIAEQAGAPVVRPRLRVHDRGARAVRGGARAAPAGRRTRRSTRCQRRVRGDRDRAQARPRDRSSPAATPDRWIVFARWGSYHGNTLGALDLSGPAPAPAPVRGLARPLPARQRRLPVPRRGLGLAGAGDDAGARRRAGPGDLVGRSRAPCARSSASRSSGRRSAAVEPPEGYWQGVADVCRHHGVLLIADEVMTGFGRTGTWFGMDHFGVRPDLLVAAKGATSGYWPFGFVAASGEVYDAVTGGGGVRPRVHLLAPARWRRPSRARCCGSSRPSRWSRRRRRRGSGCKALLDERLGAHPAVGDIRGRGLMVGRGAGARPRDARALPACREARRGGRPDRARARAAALLGHRQRERRRRRRDPARPAVRRSRTRSSCASRTASPRRWTSHWPRSRRPPSA